MRMLLVVVLFLCGGLLAGGGAWLAALGGSWFYILLGAGFIASGFLLMQRRPEALAVYALVIVATLGWSLYEVGFEWWPLAARGGLVVVIGLALLTPWVNRSLNWSGPANRLVLAAAVLLSTGVAVYAVATGPDAITGRVGEPVAAALPESEATVPPAIWPSYGRTPGGSHYSPLDTITTENVGSLDVAWQYRTGDIRLPEDPEETTYEVTPTLVDGLLYLCTPHQIAIALDPETGEEVWRHDPAVGVNAIRQHQTCRGLSHYVVETPAPPDPGVDGAPQDFASCNARILLPTSDARLIALDAKTGTICGTFGNNGSIDLWANMPYAYEGSYYSTSPPVVAGGLIVVGGAVNDNVSTTEPSGVIRAFDADTGQLVWNFDSGNPEETAPIGEGEEYVGSSPNSWSILSVDEELGLVYAPMGNAPPDQYGGDRTEETERFSSSVTALNLETGEVAWVFQTVHHDIWDMDVPSQPQLVDIPSDEGVVPALVQATKQGEIFVLNRETGEPILPVEEVPAPQGAVEGDFTAPTQPVSAMSFAPEPLQGSDMWGATILDQLYCRIRFHSLEYEGRYTAPSLGGTIVYPGNFGTFNWGGVAVDPMRRVVIANPVYLAFTVKMIPRADDTTSYVSEAAPGFNENYGAPYAVEMGPFTSPIGLPCQAPPWGYVAAADLMTGDIIWQHRNGTVRDLSPLPLPFEMGVPAIGGPIVTAGGVAFHSGTLDYYVRAFDVTTGEELWRERLPAGGQATPMTFEGEDGRQYLVVVAGGHGSTGTEAGDYVIAYALPESGG